MTCTNCGFDLESGYQSSDNLNLCQPCAEYDKQGNDYTLDERDEECEEDTAAREEYEASLTDGEDDRTTFDMSDDAEALASAGWGTDEDYGYYGGED
jgi:ribosome-binding protein aMBF1 (putative translation factor)